MAQLVGKGAGERWMQNLLLCPKRAFLFLNHLESPQEGLPPTYDPAPDHSGTCAILCTKSVDPSPSPREILITSWTLPAFCQSRSQLLAEEWVCEGQDVSRARNRLFVVLPHRNIRRISLLPQ